MLGLAAAPSTGAVAGHIRGNRPALTAANGERTMNVVGTSAALPTQCTIPQLIASRQIAISRSVSQS